MKKLYRNYGKIICVYDLENRKLIKDTDKLNDKFFLENKKYVLCFEIENKEDFIYNDSNISFQKFPWRTYYKINRELLSVYHKNNTKINAWNHWYNHGKKEERAFSFINNTNDHRARFGNLFFLNMCLHLFSVKYNLKSSYKYEKEFNQLGIHFYKGNNMYNKNYLLTDYNFEELLESDASPKNIIINNDVWFHTNRFCKLIESYFIKNNLFKKVMDKNYYKERYNNNNDLFIHIRLGDVEDITMELLSYFDKTIESLIFHKGYIASDNINHEICRYLSNKYKLIFIKENEIKTIMFGSTCKNIILSGGTFSWLIGFLATKNANIFYPDIKKKWYGNIFNFKNWKKIVV
jgi:hypothetical protein